MMVPFRWLVFDPKMSVLDMHARELDFLATSTSAPRRLPSLPLERSPSSSRPTSTRPLPPIPRALACKKCKTTITSISLLLPLEAIPVHSRAFRGFSGKASLFTDM
ncbi:hypothetical protein D9758_002059 [Tetrapyrgos nigripes]|uniref:Uncharacterized protein n=1 Tax=Tetrapyrgos nigripes TaxID=182062 RepID=A0A8H5LVC0_9AGAR|nr:hypothetical protein D9758_002059 [Tetrapyrgos nigripes]